MATTEKNTATGKKVRVKLPRLNGHNANQDEFFSVNFKNYIIKRGETVEISEELAEVIENADKADEYAMRYAEEVKMRSPQA